jgi:hypothetical protein
VLLTLESTDETFAAPSGVFFPAARECGPVAPLPCAAVVFCRLVDSRWAPHAAIGATAPACALLPCWRAALQKWAAGR